MVILGADSTSTGEKQLRLEANLRQREKEKVWCLWMDMQFMEGRFQGYPPPEQWKLSLMCKEL